MKNIIIGLFAIILCISCTEDDLCGACDYAGSVKLKNCELSNGDSIIVYTYSDCVRWIEKLSMEHNSYEYVKSIYNTDKESNHRLWYCNTHHKYKMQ